MNSSHVKAPTVAQDAILQGGACCAWALQTAIHRMDETELLLSKEDADFIADRILDSLLHWQGMRRSCKDAGVKRWGFRPKHHYLEHLAESVRRTRVKPSSPVLLPRRKLSWSYQENSNQNPCCYVFMTLVSKKCLPKAGPHRSPKDRAS